jgi:hypothetical protein
MSLDIIHNKLSIVGKIYFQLPIQRNRENLFLNLLPSGLLWRRGLLNRLNHLSSFMKIVFTRKNTYNWKVLYKIKFIFKQTELCITFSLLMSLCSDIERAMMAAFNERDRAFNLISVYFRISSRNLALKK